VEIGNAYIFGGLPKFLHSNSWMLPQIRSHPAISKFFPTLPNCYSTRCRRIL